MISAKELVDRLNGYNKKQGRKPLDFSYIEGKIKKRNAGYKFSIDDYVEAMIYSMLSSATVWQNIVDSKKEIEDIFRHFSAADMRTTDSDEMFNKLRNKTKCCGQSTNKQIRVLKDNISVFDNIADKYGTIDKYIVTTLSEKVGSEGKVELIRDFATDGSEFKLKQMGIPLVCEFLRNVGINTVKPDRHICRIVRSSYLNILSPNLTERLDRKKDLNGQDQLDILVELEEYAKASGVEPYVLDGLLWDYCASGRDNAGVCEKKSHKCNECVLRDVCLHE